MGKCRYSRSEQSLVHTVEDSVAGVELDGGEDGLPGGGSSSNGGGGSISSVGRGGVASVGGGVGTGEASVGVAVGEPVGVSHLRVGLSGGGGDSDGENDL